jgi:hypothetical protein
LPSILPPATPVCYRTAAPRRLCSRMNHLLACRVKKCR